MSKITEGVFARLDGAPAQLLVAIGLALVLFAPLIPTYKLSRVEAARAQVDQLEAMVELETNDLRNKQEAENKRDEQDPNLAFEERARRRDERRANIEKREQELKQQFDTTSRRRAAIDAYAAAAGTWWHTILLWIGRVMLILGLLVMLVMSEGTRQIVLLIVLAIVLFSSLSGVNLSFDASGRLGEMPRPPERPPQTSPSPPPFRFP